MELCFIACVFVSISPREHDVFQRQPFFPTDRSNDNSCEGEQTTKMSP